MRSHSLSLLLALSSSIAGCVSPGEPVVDHTLPPPASVSVEGNPVESGVLTAVAELPAGAPNEAKLAFVWYVNQKAVADAVEAKLDGHSFSKGDTVEVEARVAVGVVMSEPVRSKTVTILNTKPVAVVAFDATAYRTDDTIAVTATGDDDDGDPVTYTYAWQVNGTPVVGADGPSLPGTAFEKGNVVQVSVTPQDGTDDGEAVNASVTIQNSAPTLASAGLTPSVVYTTTDLSATTGTPADADGDTVTYAYQWYADSAPLVGQTFATLPGGTVARGAVVKVLVTPTDGSDAGLPVFSQDVTVQNSAPEVSVSIGSGPFYTDSTLSVTPISFDADVGDVVSFAFAWLVNGNAAGADSASLSGSAFSKHDRVWVLVTAYDGLNYSSPVSAAAVTIQNSAPSIVSADLAAGPVTTAGTVSINAVNGWSDADGDVTGTTVAWYVDGTLVGGQTGTTLTGAFFQKGQQVYAQVTPFDGEDAGTALQTGSLTIQNTPPVISAVTLASAGSRFARNLAINAVVTSSDADGDGRTYTYAWYVNGAASGQTGAAFPTDTAVYGDAVTVVVQASDGTALSGLVASTAAVLQNALPAAPAVTILPAKPAETSTLIYATYTGPAFDADGDSVSYQFEWTKNGAPFASGVTQMSGPFSKRDTWVVSVTPFDGSEYGAAGTASTFIHEKAVGLSGGGNYTCWLTDHGDVRCSGKNDGGVLGLVADGASYFAPQVVSGFPLPVATLAAGQNHACAAVTDGRVYCWGDNSWGQLGQASTTLGNSSTPVYVAGTTDAVEVGAGDGFSCFRKSDNTVWCWGRDDLGQLGDNVNAPNDTQPTPQQVVGITSVPSQLAVGGSHACVRLDTWEVKCWGSNQNCVLGTNPQFTGFLDQAMTVSNFASANPQKIAVGENLTCVWTLNGGFACVGDTSALGSASASACVYSPVEVNGFHFGSPAPAAVALGRTANCGLESDGSVRCWTLAGYDTYTPGATSISASNDSFCALDGTGASTCYLSNTYGEQGAPGGFSSAGRSTIGFGGY